MALNSSPFAPALQGLQKLGGALMLPVAILPAAALLLRLGQPDLLNIPVVSAAGSAIFNHLGLIFAIGVSVGFAKGRDGAAGLAGAGCFVIAMACAKSLIQVSPESLAGLEGALRNAQETQLREQTIARFNVPIGILSGILSGIAYNRFAGVALPSYLAFFSGRRFVLIVAAVLGLSIGVVFGVSLPSLGAGMTALSNAILEAGGPGLFVYGLLNRLLIPTGLHHILNNLAWFIVGDYEGATGDLNRFFANDPDAGAFMAGFFPIMMFGLPAACFAMYRAAPKDKRAQVGGLYASMALTSLLTGVTEPIEFAFIFAAPLLYFAHSVMTGASMFVMDALGVRLGFGFSAGVIDYIINFTSSTKPLVVFPVGLTIAVVYYFMFAYGIRRYGVALPGLANGEAESDAQGGPTSTDGKGKAEAYIAALGGVTNIVTLSACATRLRLEIKSQDGVDEPALKRLGAKAVVRPSLTGLQVVIGPEVDQLEQKLAARLAEGDEPDAPVLRTSSAETQQLNKSSWSVYPVENIPSSVCKAFGGAENIGEAHVYARRRLCVDVLDASRVNGNAVGEDFVFVDFPGRAPDQFHILFKKPGAL